MIPEFGTFFIILALCFSMTLMGSAWYAKHATQEKYQLSISLYQHAITGQFVFLLLAMLCLIISLITNDITVLYVREHSHPTLPLLYRIGAAWGGHEGSLLLWCLILTGWTFLFKLFGSRALSTNLRLTIFITLGLISTGFLLFLLLTSSPFLRDFPLDQVISADLTPVLQDPGLIFHPPVLYTGYVGTAIGFAFAIGALFAGEMETSWSTALKPWVMIPWALLGAGIVSGSWWAYRELGWGGWWFWDPVENASLLPWLAATALFHSLLVSKRGAFMGWSLVLALLTFTLSLIGTFLVRSGVLVSVHAFANDPARGLFLLIFLALITLGSFILYAIRAKQFYRPPNFTLFSRETFLLLNTLFLLTVIFTILIGTLYPIILDALHAGKISVGEPYFNTIFIPFMLLLLLAMGAAPHIRWQKEAPRKFLHDTQLTLLSSFLLALLFPYLTGFTFYWKTFAGLFFAIWALCATLVYAYKKFRKSHLRTKPMAMIIAHLGIAILAIGIIVNKSYSAERQLRLQQGQTVSLSGYQFRLTTVTTEKTANYQTINLIFSVYRNNTKISQKFVGILTAEQRIFDSHHESLAHPGILYNLWRDLYIAPGNRWPDGSWSIRIYYRPFVRWIWIGGLLTVIGGLLAVIARRKREKET